MPQRIASIFHISDLHLYVDQDGQVRSSETRLGRLREHLAECYPWVPLIGRMGCHDGLALGRLVDDLPVRIAEEQAQDEEIPVMVVHTGDVEGLGGVTGIVQSWRDEFPSWAYLDSLLSTCQVDWLHTFGNHDTWPGVFPGAVIPPNHVNCGRITAVPMLQGDWWTAQVLSTPSGLPLVIARVNTVPCSISREVRASAAVTAVPRDSRPELALLEQLRDVFAPYRDIPAIRIAIMHHPPHAFAVSGFDRRTTAHFDAAQEVANALSDMSVQVVLAGHRHELDPPLGAERYGFTQRPLKAPTVQLVAETPTQRVTEESDDLDGTTGRSFSLYRLLAEDGGSTFAIERTVFRDTLGGGGFRPEPDEVSFDQIPFQ